MMHGERETIFVERRTTVFIHIYITKVKTLYTQFLYTHKRKREAESL